MLARVLLMASTIIGANSMTITPETWEDLSVDKTVFLRFVSSTCTHCARMQGDWDKLVDEFKSSSEVVVAQINCGGSHKDFCRDRRVMAYPTIKYGHKGHLEPYGGSQDIYGMRKFVKKLKRPCNPDTLKGCHVHQVREIRRLSTMSDEQLEAFIEKIHTQTKELEEDLIVKKKEMATAYQKMVQEHKDAIAELHEEGDFAMHHIVLHHRRTSEL